MSTDARLEALETKLAFQEDAIQKMSDVLFAQENRIQALQTGLKHLAERLREVQSGVDTPAGDEPPPPHY